MQVKAQLNNLKISPRKVRLVANLVKGMKVADALDQLRFLNKKSSDPISVLIRSAIANAEHNFKLDPSTLVIKEFRVDKGLTIKRYMPRAFGRANMIKKFMSKVSLTLEGNEGKGKQVKEETKEVSSKTAKVAKKPAAKKKVQSEAK